MSLHLFHTITENKNINSYDNYHRLKGQYCLFLDRSYDPIINCFIHRHFAKPATDATNIVLTFTRSYLPNTRFPSPTEDILLFIILGRFFATRTDNFISTKGFRSKVLTSYTLLDAALPGPDHSNSIVNPGVEFESFGCISIINASHNGGVMGVSLNNFVNRLIWELSDVADHRRSNTLLSDPP